MGWRGFQEDLSVPGMGGWLYQDPNSPHCCSCIPDEMGVACADAPPRMGAAWPTPRTFPHFPVCPLDVTTAAPRRQDKQTDPQTREGVTPSGGNLNLPLLKIPSVRPAHTGFKGAGDQCHRSKLWYTQYASIPVYYLSNPATPASSRSIQTPRRSQDSPPGSPLTGEQVSLYIYLLFMYTGG